MNKELVDYIKQQLSLSVSKNKITDILLEQGWHQAEIDEAFLDAESDAIRDGGGVSGQSFNDRGRENGPGGKKLLLVAGLGAVAMLILAAIAGSFFGSSDQDQKQAGLTPDNSETEAPAPEVAQNEEPNQETALQENQADPALLAEVAKLEKTITAPAGWTSRQGMMDFRPMVVFFKPEREKDEGGNNIFSENINIVRDNLTIAESEYVAKAKEALKSNVGDYKIISERKVNLADGTAATLIGGSFVQNKIAMKNMQLYAAKNSKIYIITGVVLEKNWDAEKDLIGAAVMSFQFPAD
jgi:hypothetical protein